MIQLDKLDKRKKPFVLEMVTYLTRCQNLDAFRKSIFKVKITDKSNLQGSLKVPNKRVFFNKKLFF